MIPRLTIARKGLILVAVPLVFEFLFVGILTVQLLRAQHEIQQERRARAIVSHLNQISRIAEEAAVALALYKNKHSERSLRTYEKLVARSDGEFQSLRLLVDESAPEREMIDRLEMQTKQVVSILQQGRENKESVSHAFVSFFALPDLIKAGTEAKVLVDTIAAPYLALERTASDNEAAHRSGIAIALLAGLVINTAIAMGLALFFSREIASRLHTLIDNSRRLGRGEELLANISGSDEIGDLDKEFHAMSKQIKAAEIELKRLANQAQESEETTRSVIDNMPIGVLVSTIDDTIEAMNPSAKNMLGFSDDAPPASLRELIVFSDQRKARTRKTDEIKKGGPRIASEALCRRADGTDFPAEVAISKFSVSSGKRLLVTVQDISEKKEIENLKKEFVGMVSHDMRAPLSALRLTVELAIEGVYGAINEQGQKRFRVAEQSIDRLISMINELLDLEKLDAAESLNLAETDLDSVMEYCIESLAPLAASAEVQLQFQQSRLSALTDRDRLLQVMVNLISNAIKFSPPGKTVCIIATAESPNEVKIEVADQGRGIPAEAQQKIFDRYAQVRASDRTTHKGTGLGLAICKSIVEKCGGKIGVVSKENEGSTFWFTLPSIG